jgi:hypothetical protein
MMEGAGQKAAAPRDRFKSIPGDRRAANQTFIARVWRGLSWLERSCLSIEIKATRGFSRWLIATADAIAGFREKD